MGRLGSKTSSPWIAALGIAAPALLLAAAMPAAAGYKQEERLRQARWVYESVLDDPAERVPGELLRRTRCVAIFPRHFQAALGFGGSYGLGVASCRGETGGWSPPAFLKLSGGSLGLQIGVKREQMILFFVTEKGARALLEPRFALGGEVSVAAGPADRESGVSSDDLYREDVYVFSEAKGLFAGVSVEGSRLAVSAKANRRYYGSNVWPEQILFDQDVPEMPPEAQPFVDGLERFFQ